MPTERLEAANPAHITRAARLLREGGTVAFPTETVYGLGANALDATAVERIFVAKQRPHWDPLICHIDSPAMLELTGGPGSRTARLLMDRFWPGPLTLLVPRAPGIPDIVTAGRPLVGVRMPAHPVALALIAQAGVPIAAPSANTFGHTSPTTAQHVLDDLDGRIDAILDGGPTSIGVESTVVGILRHQHYDDVILYRAGGITIEMLESVDGICGVLPYQAAHSETPIESLPSPGVSMRHYAPRAPLILVNHKTQDDRVRANLTLEDTLVEGIDRATTASSRLGVLLPAGWNPSAAAIVFPWGPWHDADTLARRLYFGLRLLDDQGATTIVCPVPQGQGIAEALRDRLQKAAK